jgi:hypothetical protein
MDHDHWRAVAARLALLSASDGEAAQTGAGRIGRGTEYAAGNDFPKKSPERTVFDTIPAKAKWTFKGVNIGFTNSLDVLAEEHPCPNLESSFQPITPYGHPRGLNMPAPFGSHAFGGAARFWNPGGPCQPLEMSLPSQRNP